MKKLIVATMATLLGVAAHAAAVNWEIKSDWVSSDGENPLEVAVYAFDALANPLASITAALDGGDTSALSKAIASGLVNDEGAFKFSGNTISDDGGTPASASVYAILLDASAASEATGYFASDAQTVELTDAVLAGQADFVWDEINVTSFSPIGSGPTPPTPPVIPEPTSGLLLLIGAAGLALKRKNA